ncbi:MAG: alpha/beta fold hydrolase [Myxococcota bacterium]
MPDIRFCTTRDDKRMAYAIDGDGPAIVLPAWWISHVQRDWEEDGFRAFFSSLAEDHTVVRYDRIGAGLSDRERDQADITIDREVADLTVLIDHLGFDQVSLLGISCGGPIALTYAARNPDKVDKLIFFASYLRGVRVGTAEIQEAMLGLVRASWGLGSKTLAALFTPDVSAEDIRRSSSLQRAWADGEMAAQLLTLTYRGDVSEIAGQSRAPSLVMHRQQDHVVPFDAGRELAASLPNATFVPLAGNAHVPWEGDTKPVLDATRSFLGVTRSPAAEPPSADANHNTLVRRGDVWLLSFGGELAHFKHSKGLTDLAVLLARPGHEVAAAALMRGGLVQEAEPGSDPVLDDRARAEFRARVQSITEELEEARGFNDLGRTERLEAEQEAILGELAAATGLGGRSRKLKDPSERARKAVSARIRESINRIGDAHPAAGAHFRDAVRTGVFCCYEPADPIEWEL